MRIVRNCYSFNREINLLLLKKILTAYHQFIAIPKMVLFFIRLKLITKFGHCVLVCVSICRRPGGLRPSLVQSTSDLHTSCICDPHCLSKRLAYGLYHFVNRFIMIFQPGCVAYLQVITLTLILYVMSAI